MPRDFTSVSGGPEWKWGELFIRRGLGLGFGATAGCWEGVNSMTGSLLLDVRIADINLG